MEAFTISEMQRHIARTLTPLYGERESRWIARVAMEHVTRKNHVDLIVYGDSQLSDYARDKALAILSRLEKGEPIQYITGEAPFCGYTFEVNPSTLIPRPETAELVDAIVDDAGSRADLRVLDIGTGSGCIAIALERRLRFATVEGVDISAEAVETARRNARRNKSGATFAVADVFGWVPSGRFDILVSNPPYIAESERAEMAETVTAYEPGRALFVSDSDPLVFYRRISALGMECLDRGGRLYFEINPRFADPLSRLVEETGYADVTVSRDSQGRLRFLKALRP